MPALRGGAVTTPRRVAQLARAQQVLELAALGASVAEIAAVLDVPDEVVRRTLMLEERRAGPALEALRAEYQRLQLQRLEDVLLAHMGGALQGKHKDTDKVIKILEREAALLGLDEPKRSEVEQTVTARYEPDLSASTPEELEAMIRVLDDARAEAAVDVTPKQLTNGSNGVH